MMTEPRLMAATTAENWTDKTGNVALTLNTTESENNLEHLNDEFAKLLSPVLVTLGFLMVVGILGNSLVVIVYWQWIKMMGTTKRIFILTLAHLDLTVCTIAIPFEIYDIRNQFNFQNLAACTIGRILEYSIVLASGFVLVSVSVERYVYLCKAFKKFSQRKAKVICIGCVVLAFVVGGPSGTFAGIKKTKLMGTDIYGYECSWDSKDKDAYVAQKVFYYILSAVFLVCVCVLIVIYFMIWKLLRTYQKQSLKHTDSIKSLRNEINKGLPQHDGSVAKESRSGSSESTIPLRRTVSGQRTFKSPVSIIVFFSVTVTFMASFLPHIIIRFLQFFNVDFENTMDKQTSELLYNFCIRSYLVGNVSNPFIYSLLNKQFRFELRRCMRKLYKRGKYEHRRTYLIDL